MSVKPVYFLMLACILFSLNVIAQSDYTVNLYDAQKDRIIPVAVYSPRHVNKNTPVIIFNHGYGQNDTNSYQMYSDLNIPLARKGYYVISIQHELPGDPLLTMTGNLMQTRMVNWEGGVDHILFVIKEFKKLKPELGWEELTIMGHSNGGDMAMLFATKYPELIRKAISLDHRRMIMPRCESPRIYTLRGSDYEADENVIPSIEEQQKYAITVIRLERIRHGDMDNKGSREQHDVMLRYIYRFLRD